MREMRMSIVYYTFFWLALAICATWAVVKAWPAVIWTAGISLFWLHMAARHANEEFQRGR